MPPLDFPATIMTSFFNFGAAPVDVDIRLTGEDDRKQVEVKGEKDQKVMCPVYYDGESIVGQVSYVFLVIEAKSSSRRSMSE